MTVIITADDLPEMDEAKAEEMIEDALALATLHAPCINDDDFPHTAAAKAILRAVIRRWNESGTGATVQQVAGVFQQTITPMTRRGSFLGSEIENLQKLCRPSGVARAYEVDVTTPGAGLAPDYFNAPDDCFGPWGPW